MAYKFQLGDAIMSGSLTQEEQLQVQGDLTAKSDARFDGDLVAKSNVTIDGDLVAKSSARIDGAIDANSSANIQGAVVLQSTLNAQGAVDCDSTLNVDGASTLAAVTADGAIDFSSTLNVDGASTLAAITMDGALINSSTSNLQGAVDCDSTLNVDGASTLAAVTADGAIDFSSTLNVDGASTLAAVTADGAIDFSSTLNVDGAATMAAISAAGLTLSDLTDNRLPLVGASGLLQDNAALGYVDDRANLNGYLALYASSSASGSAYLGDGLISINNKNGDEVCTINGSGADFAVDTTVDGTISGSGGLSIGTSLKMYGGGIDMSGGDGTAAAINMVDNVDEGFMIRVNGDSNWMTFKTDNGDERVTSDKAFYAPSISGSGVLTIAGAVNFNSTLDVVGALTAVGALSNFAAVTTSGALIAESTVNAQGAVDCDSTLNVDGASTMAAITADGAIDFSSTLNVDGASTLAAITADGAIVFSNASVQFSSIAETAMDLAADDLYYRDSDGSLKKYSWADLASDAAGAGISAAGGVFSADGAVAPSAWSNGGTLSEGLNYAADLGSGVAQAMSLPASASSEAGDQISIKAAALPDGATMTINAVGSQDIDGASALVLESPYAAVSLVYVGSDKWRIV